MSSVSLNSTVKDEDGNERELIETILDENGINLEAWLDFKNFYQSRPQKERRAIRKLIKEDWRRLSGYDWRLIKQFRRDFAERTYEWIKSPVQKRDTVSKKGKHAPCSRAQTMEMYEGLGKTQPYFCAL